MMIKKIIRKIKPKAQSILDVYLDNTRTTGEIGDADFHVDLIVHLASIIRPKCYVELGVYKCETFNRVSKFSECSFAVDVESRAGSFCKSGSFYHGNTQDFLEFFKTQNKKIDLLFIDADHSAGSVKQEFSSFFPYIADQGLILMHDGFPLNKAHTVPEVCGDSYLTIGELSREAVGYEMVTIPFPPGLTICRKRTKQVPWE